MFDVKAQSACQDHSSSIEDTARKFCQKIDILSQTLKCPEEYFPSFWRGFRFRPKGGMELAHRGNMKDPIRVVFVEDDPEMLAIYAENFLLPEFQIGTALNGEKAIELLRNSVGRIDVLVTDNHMQQMDGIKLLRIVRQEFPEIKLLMVTGYGNWTDYVEAHNIGIHKFIDKPIKMSELKNLIRGIL
jgi:two-component system response regulator (stage 0 sporulation protein F)